MKPSPSFRAVTFALLAAVLTASAAPTASYALEKSAPTATISRTSQVLSNRPGILHKGYNYAPTAFYDPKEEKFHVYWCGFHDSSASGGNKGDHVLHAEAERLVGPWHAHGDPTANTFDIALRPSGVEGSFDRLHTCDPSVIFDGERWYLYYGGLGIKRSSGIPTATRIGVATSADGITFTRANGGREILGPSRPWSEVENPNRYGVGQPSVTFRRPYFYMSFTDTSARGANRKSGAGQFMIRSKDPLFLTDVEEFTAKGWAPLKDGVRTGEHSFMSAFSIDLAYDVQTDLFFVAANRRKGATDIVTFSPETLQQVTQTDLENVWGDGPGFVTDSRKRLIHRPECSDLHLSTIVGADARSGSKDPWKWQLTASRAGFDASTLCAR